MRVRTQGSIGVSPAGAMVVDKTELSTSVDKLLFRIPNVLEATKPRK